MLASTLITLALAEYASRDDFHQIGKGSKIRHGIQWLFRAAVVALACYLDDCMLYAVPLAFLFSAVFRWRLNALRGKDWRYVAPWSSLYDKLWFKFEMMDINYKEDVPLLIQYGPQIYNTKSYVYVQRFDNMANMSVVGDHYRDWIHRAGTMAYIFEGVCFVAGTVWYICSA